MGPLPSSVFEFPGSLDTGAIRKQTDEQGEEPFTGRAEVVPVASDHGPLTRPATDGLMVPERKEMRLLCSQQSLP